MSRHPRSTQWVYSSFLLSPPPPRQCPSKWSVCSVLKRQINILHGKNSFIPWWDISNLIYGMVFKCLKAFVRQVFNRLKNLVSLEVLASDIISEGLLTKIYSPILLHVIHIFLWTSLWTKIGDFSPATTCGVTTNSTVEPTFSNCPSLGSRSYKTSACSFSNVYETSGASRNNSQIDYSEKEGRQYSKKIYI